METTVKQRLTRVIYARFIRLKPTQWELSTAGMRAELIGCYVGKFIASTEARLSRRYCSISSVVHVYKASFTNLQFLTSCSLEISKPLSVVVSLPTSSTSLLEHEGFTRPSSL
jgi:hypothetical protein